MSEGGGRGDTCGVGRCVPCEGDAFFRNVTGLEWNGGRAELPFRRAWVRAEREERFAASAGSDAAACESVTGRNGTAFPLPPLEGLEVATVPLTPPVLPRVKVEACVCVLEVDAGKSRERIICTPSVLASTAY